ncbi:MAG: mannose-6-phosphate isomerase, class I, partial [Anaerolineae bacterium]
MEQLPDVAPRPYRMHNQIQHYAWGTTDEDAFISDLLGMEPEPGVPYAELWMGAHPKAPSAIEADGGETVPLDAWIAAHPHELLGQEVAERFGQLPFLFKVLSAGQSLSIQAHPTKAQAEALHEKDLEHYPDDNHKPEIAVTLDHLTALMGFKPLEELAAVLEDYPEMATFVGTAVADRVRDGVSANGEALADEAARRLTRELFTTLIERATDDPGALAEAVDALARRLAASLDALGEVEARFLELRQRYGSRDVGLFAMLLFNLVHLEAGEAIYTKAGVPHAYLGGNIVECMANSDNVVRVGLTPKYKDAETLLKIVDTTPQEPEVLEGAWDVKARGITAVVYKTPADEFEIRRWELAPGAEHTVNTSSRPAVLLLTEGEVEIVWETGRMRLSRGETAFIPACLPMYTVRTIDGARIVWSGVPDPEGL